MDTMQRLDAASSSLRLPIGEENCMGRIFLTRIFMNALASSVDTITIISTDISEYDSQLVEVVPDYC